MFKASETIIDNVLLISIMQSIKSRSIEDIGPFNEAGSHLVTCNLSPTFRILRRLSFGSGVDKS